MTTIAYRDGILAADTKVTWGEAQLDGYQIKIVKRGRILATAVGLQAPALRFMDWVKGGCLGEPPNMGTDKDHDATGIIFMPDGLVLNYRIYGWTHRRCEYYAQGSGCDYATGAMARGASAYEAVLIAKEFDGATGGPITVLSHAP